jgi:hypothetical protein
MVLVNIYILTIMKSPLIISLPLLLMYESAKMPGVKLISYRCSAFQLNSDLHNSYYDEAAYLIVESSNFSDFYKFHDTRLDRIN